MNPLSLLLRALDRVPRALLSLREVPWRRLARTGLAWLTDRQRWRRAAARAQAPHRWTFHLTAAAALGVVVAAASIAAAGHDGRLSRPAGYSAALGWRSDTQQHAHAAHAAHAARGDDRSASGSGDSSTTTRTGRRHTAKRSHPAKHHRYVARWSTWRLPVHAKHYWISSRFGKRWGVLHAGVDLAVPIGTPIHAAHSGRVSIAGRYGGYGLAVGIENGHGIATVYGHASRLIIHDGQWVHAGQTVALSGNTGDSTGPHVHFEMRRHGVPFNPLPFLRTHGLHLVDAAGIAVD